MTMKYSIHLLFFVVILSGCIFSSDSKDSKDYSSLGEQQYKKGEYQSAIDYYDKALIIDSSNSTAYPGLIKSKIKRDSLVEKYFNIILTQNDSQTIGFLDSNIQQQDAAYQKVKELKRISRSLKNSV